MKLTAQEKADRKAAFALMSIPEKLEYVFAYYKLPLVLLLIGLIFAGSVLSRQITRKNELLYLGLVNVAAGEDMQERLTGGFVRTQEADPRKNEVYLYADMYISDDPPAEYHEYSYASKLKILAAIDAKEMDVVFLNRESYDIFSRNGYLLDLSVLLTKEAPGLLPEAGPLLTENEIILEDNSIEMELGTADSYQAQTMSQSNALEVTSVPVFASAGFQEPVFLGVIANSPREKEASAYIQYILTAGGQTSSEAP